MSQVTVTLNKSEVEKVVKMFKGAGKEPGIQNARKIAETLGFPRRQVMAVLENKGLATYSEASYA